MDTPFTTLIIEEKSFMAKLVDEKINSSDLQEYLNDYSDFNFEMNVLNSLPSNFEVEHGGTYKDPITNKFREFDIRAKHTSDHFFECNTYLAVEAKNLRENFPVLVSCIPRTKEEAFHELVVSKFTHRKKRRPYGQINKIRHHHNKIYKQGEFVGKSLDQIGRKAHDNSLQVDDSEIYIKWSQAVNSCYELAQNAYLLSKKDTNHSVYVSLILPIVVIPDGTLWKVDFDLEGKQINEPVQCNSCQYFIGNEFQIGDAIGSDNFTISHLHIMTFSGFKEFINNYEDYVYSFFPKERIHF